MLSISHSSNTHKTAARDKEPWIKWPLSCFARKRSISEVHSYRSGDGWLGLLKLRAESSSCERFRGVTNVDGVDGELDVEVMVSGGKGGSGDKRGPGKMLADLRRDGVCRA